MGSSKLTCALVSEIGEPLRTTLLTNYSNKRNPRLVKKLQNYLNETAKYYLVYFDTTPLFFFSLQASCIFTEQYAPSEELLCAAERLKGLLRDPNVKIMSKQDVLVMAYWDNKLELDRILSLNEDDIKFELDDLTTAAQYLADQNDPDVSDFSIYSKVTPAIELVEFCKCDSEKAKKMWVILRTHWANREAEHTPGEFVFYRYILPIVFQVSQHVGCKLLLLYAADSSETESLVNYYIGRLHFVKPGGDIVVNKPMYDVGCKLLIRDLDELKKIRESVIKDFTNMQPT